MKKVILTLNLAILFACLSYGQLSGTYYIPINPGYPSYQTIKAAVSDLNALGISGSVTFLIAPGHEESVAEPVLLTATGSATKPIVFQKNGSGTNPKITRTDIGTIITDVVDGQGDAVVIIHGSDYVTFDGIDLTAVSTNIEYGYYLRKVSGTDACKNVTIKNARIQMNKGTSPYVCGIFSSNNNDWSTFYTVTVTSTGGRTENLVIKGNTIENVHTGIRIIGYNHNASPYNFSDSIIVLDSQARETSSGILAVLQLLKSLTASMLHINQVQISALTASITSPEVGPLPLKNLVEYMSQEQTEADIL